METQWKGIQGKQIKLIFDDGFNHFSKRIGKVTEVNSTHIILQVENKTEAILLSRVIRLEGMKND